MKVHQVAYDLEARYGKGRCDVECLDKTDLRKLRPDVEEIWYWYAVGCYEGMGAMIMRVGDLYAFRDMGHCSCYGPTDNIHNRAFRTLSDEIKNCSSDCLIDFQPLIDEVQG